MMIAIVNSTKILYRIFLCLDYFVHLGCQCRPYRLACIFGFLLIFYCIDMKFDNGGCRLVRINIDHIKMRWNSIRGIAVTGFRNFIISGYMNGDIAF